MSLGTLPRPRVAVQTAPFSASEGRGPAAGMQRPAGPTLLIAARELIASPDTWTQNEFARDVDGRPVEPTDPAAVRFDAQGAIYRLRAEMEEDVAALQRLAVAMGAEPTRLCGMDVSGFNDRHTHAEVLAAFDRAIASAR